jgi:hypothetical protein
MASIDTRRVPRARALAPILIGLPLFVLGGMLWARLIAHVIDYWDSASLDRREDFVAFYAAASLVRDGLGWAIYRPDVVSHAEELLLGRSAGRVGGLAFMNPPFVAGVMQPLTLLPYGVAQAIWFAASALCVAISLLLLWPDLRALRRRWLCVFGLAVAASFPVFMSLLYGQLSPVVLLAWVASYRLGARGHGMRSGLALAGALVKPQLAVVPAIYLIVTGRWRALGGFALGAASLALASIALVGPHLTFVGYPSFLLESMHWRQDYGVNRIDMFGWHGFFVREVPGIGANTTLLVATLLSGATLVAAAIVWRTSRNADRAWAAVLAIAAATVLTSPHIHTHDLLILVMPAALIVAARRDAISISVAGLLLFAVPMGMIRINVGTPLLAAVLAALVVYVLRRADDVRASVPAPA